MNDRRERKRKEDLGYEKKVITLRRVAKVTAGGKRLRFSAMVVAGDRKGSVGVALGRGTDTRSAVEKAERKAAKNMKKIALVGDTIPHDIRVKSGAAYVMLRPAKPGSGVIAGSSSRTVLELAGIENVYCKQLGSHDAIANTYCTFKALISLRNDRVLKRMRNMRERIGLKEKMDVEKQKLAKKSAAKRKNSEKEKRNNINNRKNATRKGYKAKK